MGRSFTLQDVARAVGGRVAGNPALRLSGVQGLDAATSQDLSWVAHSGRAREAEISAAGALLVSSEADARGRPAVVVDQPAIAFARFL
jgi:UDP-3-O-[3-hydroxymyristoyl] glucosamine N-acyltransferase